MQQIDKRLESLSDFMMLISSALAPKVLELRRLKNAAAPIHQLPQEIFVDILLGTLEQQDSWTSTQLHTLAQVSSGWSNTIKLTASFWRHISANDSEYIQHNVIRVNSAGPLKIVCNSDDPKKNESTIQIALPHSSRWQSVLFNGGIPESFSICPSLPTPNLTEMFVYKEAGFMIYPKIILGPGCDLRTIDLEGIPLSWDSDRLRNLRAIALRGMYGNVPTVGQLYDMLASSPRLTCLILSNLHPESEVHRPQSPSTHHPLKLCELSKLFLADIPSEITDFLISTIVCPNHIRVDVDDALIPPINAPLTKALHSILKVARSLMLVYDSHTGSMMIQTEPSPEMQSDWVYNIKPENGCRISFRPQPPAQDGRRLASWLAGVPLPPTKLVIGFGSHQPSEAALQCPLELFASLPTLTALEIRAKCDPGPVLRYLASRPEGERPWNCPRLTALRLDSANTATYVADVVAFASRGRGDVNAPAKLAVVQAPGAIRKALLALEAGKDIVCIVTD